MSDIGFMYEIHGNPAKAILMDPFISLAAKGVALQICEGVDPWERIYYYNKEEKDRYWRDGRCSDGIDAVNKAIRELEEYGYLYKTMSWSSAISNAWLPVYHIVEEPEETSRRKELHVNQTDKLYNSLRMDGDRPAVEGQ